MNKSTLEQSSSNDRREALLVRIEQATELPLLILAFAVVPLLAASLFWELTPNGERLVFIADVVVWALFAADLAVKTAIAPDRRGFLRQQWLDVLVVLVPFARPFRLLRIAVYGTRAFRGVTRIFNVDFLLVYAVGLVLIVATVVTTVEEGSGSPLGSFLNSLWWALTTVTTVGYGDIVPSTPMGRVAGVVLMLGGVGLVGALTANFAAMMVRRQRNSDAIEDLVQEVKSLREELYQLGGNRKPGGEASQTQP